MIRSSMPMLLVVLLLGLGGAASAGEGQRTERWYELVRNGQKAGYFQVVWAPSTWEGKPTVHDTTTQVNKSVRNMMGVKDVFESTTTLDLERAEDGTLWWQRVRVEEPGRVVVEELTWTGTGYRHVARMERDGADADRERTIEIPLKTPVMTDAESFLGHLLRAGTLETGSTHELRQLDVQGRKVSLHRLEILAAEEIEDENGAKIRCVKIKDVHVQSGATQHMWLDPDGAFVRIEGDTGLRISRVTAESARKMPVKPAEMRITTPSNPPLERIFSADRTWVDLHVRADAGRPLPEIPDSPWSRVVKTEGDKETGHVLSLELSAYDSEEKTATLPVEGEAFARDLESTVLMQSDDPRVQKVAREAIGDTTDARTAGHRLARFVIEHLADKRSPDVAQASALEILDERCGDCSEHALLFVTLCRAVGLPARRCSGYVCIGGAWGAHAWAEIFTGQWIAADPTTGEIGAGARYLFFGYQDRPNSYPGLVSTRLRGRMRFVTTRVQEGPQVLDIADPADHRRRDVENGHYLHALCGLEAREVPTDWRVSMSGSRSMTVRFDGVEAYLTASADQGYTYEFWSAPGRRRGAKTTFGGAPALVSRFGDGRVYRVFSRRRLVLVRVKADSTDALAMLEKVLRPGLVPEPLPLDAIKAPAPAAPKDDAAEGDDDAPDDDAPGDDQPDDADDK